MINSTALKKTFIPQLEAKRTFQKNEIERM